MGFAKERWYFGDALFNGKDPAGWDGGNMPLELGALVLVTVILAAMGVRVSWSFTYGSGRAFWRLCRLFVLVLSLGAALAV